MGQPGKQGEKKTEFVKVYLTPSKYAMLEAAALNANRSMSNMGGLLIEQALSHAQDSPAINFTAS